MKREIGSNPGVVEERPMPLVSDQRAGRSIHSLAEAVSVFLLLFACEDVFGGHLLFSISKLLLAGNRLKQLQGKHTKLGNSFNYYDEEEAGRHCGTCRRRGGGCGIGACGRGGDSDAMM